MKDNSKEQSIDKIPVKQTMLLKGKIKLKTLDDLGEIEEAKKHRSANRPLHKIKEFNDSVNFCWCCNLPCEEKGIIERFKYCDNVDKFSECGLGISFYFHFIRFLILILFLSICVIIISMMIFNKHYTKGINRVCNNYYKNLGYNNISLCEGFVTEAEENLNVYSRFMKDWVLSFSSDNIKIYYLLHNFITNNSKNAEDVIINYSLLNFLLLLTIFIINIGYIILINARAKKTKLKNLTIRDYTVLVSNSNHILTDYLNKMQKQNPNYITQSQLTVENTTDFIKHVNKYITEDELKIYNVNLCYNLGKYMDLRDELEEVKEKIFKIKNDKHMIDINSEKGNLINNRYYYKIPLSNFGIYCIKWKDKTLAELEKKKSELEKDIENEINNFQILSESNFTGYMFVSFNYIKDKEEILKQHPNHFFDIMLDFFINIKYYICCCCISEGEKLKFSKKKGLDIEDPPEPEDLYFENFKYSGRQRFFKIVLFFFICILIIGVSFLIVLGLTYWQNKITDDEKNINLFVKYLLSLLITIIIAILNEVLEYLLEKFTFWERHLSRTNYYLSLSVKIAILTFLNSAIIPLIAKELAVKKRINISYNIDRNFLIVDDMFVMFLVNAIVTPIFWTLNVPFLYKKIRIHFLEKKKNPDKSHYMTQKELNKLYEYPDMRTSYKYAYLMKTTAMSFFYLPIFPLGFIISFLGFILAYLLELFNFTHIYKRPEMLDESITIAYVNNFIFILFIGGVGDFFFFYEIFPSRVFSIINFVLFLVLIFVPYTKFLTCNFIGEKKKSDYYSKPLTEIYFTFYNDYQRQNPFTKRLGLTNYLKALKDKGYLSKNAFDTAIANIDQLNLMEIYYGISRGRIPLVHQSVMANTNNRSIFGKNEKLRQSLVHPNINDNEIDKKRKQKIFESQINLIFGNRLSFDNIQSFDEDPEKFPMDTINEEDERKGQLINNFNNPLAINMGFGAMPMDPNIYSSVPMTLSKRASYINNFNTQEQNYSNKNSNEISIKINNDIQNYRNKQNKLNNQLSEFSLNSENNNNNVINSVKNDYDSDNKQININMPFKASINQSQNSKETNIYAKNSSNSINNIIISSQKAKEENSIGKIPLDTSENNINTNENVEQKEKSDNSEEVNNNFNNLFDLGPNKNNNINNQNDILENSDSKNIMPMDSASNNNVSEKNNESNLINNNTDNISDIPITNDVKNDYNMDNMDNIDNIDNSNEKDIPKFPNIDKDKINIELSKSEDSDIKQDNNNELNEEENSGNDN